MFEMNEEVGIQKPIPTLQPDSKSQERKTGPTVESLQLENTVLKEKIALLERYLERLERTHDALLGKL